MYSIVWPSSNLKVWSRKNSVKLQQREIALLLEGGKDELARIRAEQVFTPLFVVYLTCVFVDGER